MNSWALFTCVLCLFAFSSVAAGASNAQSRTLTLLDIPDCGVSLCNPGGALMLNFSQLRCLWTNIPDSGCSLGDIDCICKSTELTYVLSTCMLANCTIQETLGTSRVQADLCHLSNESRKQEMILYSSIIYSIIFMFVSIRIASKTLSKRLGWDDLVIVTALVLTAIPAACVIRGAQDGLGEHLWNLKDGKLLYVLRYIYISWVDYVVVLCLLKASLLLFYIEIFTTKAFRTSAYCALGFIIVSSTIIFLVTIFACKPVAFFWDRDIKGGTCIDIQALGYAVSGTAIVQDLVLLILPLAFLRHLQMKGTRKIAVGIMFLIGTFGMVATAMRLPSLSTFKISIDPTWDYAPVCRWSEIEVVVCFICVSLPSIRVLVARIIPSSVKNLFSSKGHSSFGDSLPSSNSKTYRPRQLKIPGSQEHNWSRENLKSTFWSRNGPSHLRAGSRRLESASGDHEQDKHANESRLCSEKGFDEDIEMLAILNP